MKYRSCVYFFLNIFFFNLLSSQQNQAPLLSVPSEIHEKIAADFLVPSFRASIRNVRSLMLTCKPFFALYNTARWNFLYPRLYNAKYGSIKFPANIDELPWYQPMVFFLMDANVPLQECKIRGLNISLLDYVIQKQTLSVMKRLSKEQLTDIDLKAEQTLAYQALQSTNIQMLQMLHDMHINTYLIKPGGKTNLLHKACQLNNYEFVKALLNLNAPVNARDTYSFTPLFYARTPRMMTLLLIYGARANIQNNPKRRTPLISFVKSKTTTYLEDYFASSKSQEHMASLLYQPRIYSLRTFVGILLYHDANPLLRDYHGKTALHYAAESGYDAVMQDLLKYSNVLVDIPDRTHKTALHCAIDNEQEHCVRTLLENKANVNSKMVYNRSCLGLALIRENAAIVKMLLDYGATYHRPEGFSSLSTLQLAALWSSESIFALFKEHQRKTKEDHQD